MPGPEAQPPDRYRSWELDSDGLRLDHDVTIFLRFYTEEGNVFTCCVNAETNQSAVPISSIRRPYSARDAASNLGYRVFGLRALDMDRHQANTTYVGTTPDKVHVFMNTPRFGFDDIDFSKGPISLCTQTNLIRTAVSPIAYNIFRMAAAFFERAREIERVQELREEVGYRSA